MALPKFMKQRGGNIQSVLMREHALTGGTFKNCVRYSLSVQRISLSTTQVNCIVIVINAHI
jgi:hypothetical protein